MKLQTKYFGEIDYELSETITFPTGLFGFDDEHSFLLLPFDGSGENLKCPLVIHPGTREARQIIMETERYGMRHSLAEFASREEASTC